MSSLILVLVMLGWEKDMYMHAHKILRQRDVRGGSSSWEAILLESPKLGLLAV